MQILALFLEVSKHLTSMKEVHGFDFLIVEHLDFLIAIYKFNLKVFELEKQFYVIF